MPPTRLKNEILTAAILGFEEQKKGINVRVAELRAMLPGGTTGEPIPTKRAKRPRRKMSAAARKAIGDAQRKRWAVQNAAAKK
jgi:hypothetical protein